jgi:hypothetical protein
MQNEKEEAEEPPHAHLRATRVVLKHLPRARRRRVVVVSYNEARRVAADAFEPRRARRRQVAPDAGGEADARALLAHGLVAPQRLRA